MPGDFLKRPGQIGIAKHLSGPRRMTAQKESAGSVSVAQQLALALHPITRENLRDGKPFLRVVNRRSEHVREALAAETPQQFVPAIHRAGNRDGIDAAL